MQMYSGLCIRQSPEKILMHILNAHTVSRNKLLSISGRKFMVVYNVSSQSMHAVVTYIHRVCAARYSTIYGPLNNQA
jgi:hypothetical protein